MKVDLTTAEIEKPGVATALSTLFAAVAGSFTTCPKDSRPVPLSLAVAINSYEPFGCGVIFSEVTGDEIEQLIRNDAWADGPFYGCPFVFGVLAMGTRVAYDRRRGTNKMNAAVADAWAKKSGMVDRMTNKYAVQDTRIGAQL